MMIIWGTTSVQFWPEGSPDTGDRRPRKLLTVVLPSCSSSSFCLIEGYVLRFPQTGTLHPDSTSHQV